MNHNKELLEKIADEIFHEFQQSRTDAISYMLDNPGEYGLLRTTKCFVEIDKACADFTSEVAKRYAEEMNVHRDELLNKINEVIFGPGSPSERSILIKELFEQEK